LNKKVSTNPFSRDFLSQFQKYSASEAVGALTSALWVHLGIYDYHLSW